MQNIPKNLFEPAAANAGDAEKISKKSLSLWQDAMLRFGSNKLAMVALVIIVLFILIAIC
ncbi:ABC transporter permease, partial [Bacillus subtilis subsp. spizizenii ATCC 6633 = JCM 2499]|nr:ABC transporter permease [Bacillus spizizenii ATCC 6633 = JCM 2499]